MKREPRASRVERAFYALAFRAENDPRARAVLIALVNASFRAIAFERKLGGTRLFDYAKRAAVRFGRWRAPELAKRLGLDARSMADLGRLQDWEDRVFGVTGRWTERTPTRATKCETACPFAKAASEAPELCTDVIHALEEATFRELNPTYRLVPLTRLLSKGDSHCEFVHRIEG